MKKKRSFLLPLLMAIVMMAMSPQKVWADATQASTVTPCHHTFAEGATSGECTVCHKYIAYQGDEANAKGTKNAIHWQLVKNGDTYTLEVSGTGAMKDYRSENFPWLISDEVRSKVTAINIAQGITRIGAYAFCYYLYANSISIPEGVTSIGNNAFDNCGFRSYIKELILPASLKTIETSAFNWMGVKKIIFAEGSQLTTIGSNICGRDNVHSITFTVPTPPDIDGNAFNGMRMNVIYPTTWGNMTEKYGAACITWMKGGKLSEADKPVALTLNGGAVSASMTTGSYKFYTFTPKESGIYTYNIALSSNESVGIYLYDNSSLTSYVSYKDNNKDFSASYEMEAGKTYYFKVVSNADNTVGSTLTTAVTSGKFGEGNALKWSYSNGTLTLSGKGAVNCRIDGFSPAAPYASFCDLVTKVVVGKDITSIGEGAFGNASKLSTVEFEEGSQCTTLGSTTFFNTPMTTLTLPASCTNMWGVFNDTFIKKVYVAMNDWTKEEEYYYCYYDDTDEWDDEACDFVKVKKEYCPFKSVNSSMDVYFLHQAPYEKVKYVDSNITLHAPVSVSVKAGDGDAVQLMAPTYADGKASYTLTAADLQAKGIDPNAYTWKNGEDEVTLGTVFSNLTESITLVGSISHHYVNGICDKCGEYEPATPVYKEDGTTIDHYNIGNAGQLLWFSDFVNTEVGTNHPNCGANAVLTADIVVNDGTFDADGNFTATGASETSTPISCKPIGADLYRGTFDGDGHTISGLYYAGNCTNKALLGSLESGAVVKRLGVTNVYYSGEGLVGGIAGYNFGTIENCYSTGVLKYTGKGTSYIGGICGLNNATIRNCYSTISGINDVCGPTSEGDISNCYVLNETYYNANRFASGEICYKLNGSRSAGTEASPLVWYQNLSAEGGDSAPVLKAASDGSNTVYCGYDACLLTYANSKLSRTQSAHDFTSKTLCNDAEEGTGLYHYLCDKCGADNEDDVKVIKDYAPDADGAAKNIELTVVDEVQGFVYSTTETIALTDANQFEGVNVKFTTEAAPTYTRQMTSEWGTIVLPFEVSTQTDDYDLYKCETLLDGRLVMRILPANEAVPAGYPAFVRKKTNAESITFTAASNEVSIAQASANIGTSMQLVGTYTAQPMTNANSNSYFIYNDAFWNTNQLSDGQTVTILPFHSYIKVAEEEVGPGNMCVKLMIMVFDEEETTGIHNAQCTIHNEAGSVYNMQGQRLTAPQKGVNIVNGKKVMVK